MSEGNEVNDNGGQEQNQQVSSPAPETSWINPDGTFGDLSKAPEGVGEFITKKGFKDASSWAKSHQELESMMGNRDNLIKIPEAGDEEGFRELSRKLGCPEKPEDYQFTPEEGDPYDENLISLFKQSAHKDGMPQKAFQDVVRFQIDAIKLANKEYEKQVSDQKTAEQQALRDSFESEEQYNEFTKKALGFADEFAYKEGGPTAADVLERKGLAYDPEILAIFGALADSTKEDTFTARRTSVEVSRDDKLNAIKNSEAFVKHDHPDHKKTMEEYWALFNLTK